MALVPVDAKHQKQIIAGTLGRQQGHKFEETLTHGILKIKHFKSPTKSSHLIVQNPALALLNYICYHKNFKEVVVNNAWWLGKLATSNGEGDVLVVDGKKVSKSKSDIVIELCCRGKIERIGISVKKCSNNKPTNAQLFFTTARAFCELLRANGIKVSVKAEEALRMFCGDQGFKPSDLINSQERAKFSNPERYYWEELEDKGRLDLEAIFKVYQNEITRILLRNAYIDDPFPPEFVLHQTKKVKSEDETEIAIYSIDELVKLSAQYSGFELKGYTVKKGTYKDHPKMHYAPRFGIIQFQRGGQKQHPTQLQFNLEAGYFYKILKKS